MLKERSQSFKLLFIFLDIIISLASFWTAFYIRYFIQDSEQFLFYHVIDFQSYVTLGFVFSITQVIAFNSIDLYHPRRGLSFTDEFFTIISGVIINIIIVLAALFFFRNESFSRLVIIYFAFANIFYTTIIHYTSRFILKLLRKRGYNLRRLVIIGTGFSANAFAESISKHQIYGYKVIGYIVPKITKANKLKHKILGDFKLFSKVLRRYKPDLVVYALSNKEGDYLKEVIDECDNEGIDIKVVPGFHEFVTAKGRVEDIDGIPIISIRNIPIRLGYNKFIKRLFDILFSLFILIAFSPIFLILAVIIKLTSNGPIFIKQERVGLDNKNFYMLKFRSMYVQEKKKSDTIWTTKNDPRVTVIGKYLRKLSLDEIPQFINVLIGNMSVVGPRPERPFFVQQFKSKHHHYMRRHAVKAGITGWAQIQGLRGDTSIEERIAADIYYIENWSLLLDIKIILLTPFKGILNNNAY